MKMLKDSTHTRSLEESSSLRQKVKGGAGGWGGGVLMGQGVGSRDAGGDGCITM